MWMLAVMVSVAAFAGSTVDDKSRLAAMINAKKERTVNARLIYTLFGNMKNERSCAGPECV
jgi:hypothetical protein